MKNEVKQFQTDLVGIALPVTLQALLQSSFGVVDQIMIGQLGSESIAGIGLGGRFASLYTVVLGAVAAAAGIMVAQYVGAKDEKGMERGFYLNLVLSLLMAAAFMTVCCIFPYRIMALYTEDEAVKVQAAVYLRIYAFSFLPVAISTMMAVFLRCIGKAVMPLAASFFSVILNTGLNYLLIFGHGGFSAMGVRGAALASVISQTAAFGLTAICFCLSCKGMIHRPGLSLSGETWRQYLGILSPILICEFMWSLGENVYGSIYGHLGTEPCAAMTMTGPVQGLMIGLLSGVSQAAGIMIGRHLGKEDYAAAYRDGKRLIGCGAAGSLILSLLLLVVGRSYAAIYKVEPSVQMTAYQILLVFAIISPIKVENMILGGGIIRSGGMTRYVMWIDLIGTWLFGVPLGLLAAFVWRLPIPQVYFILSLEEAVRLLLSIFIFRRKSWMRKL